MTHGPIRAAIYARYSSDRQSANSIEDQVRVCRRRIAQEGWSEGAVYTDHAISGASQLDIRKNLPAAASF